MVLATLALLCCNALPADLPEVPAEPSTSVLTASESEPQPVLPDAPVAKILVPAAEAADAISPAIEPASPNAAIKPIRSGSYETPRQRKIWYGLIAVGHSAAAFDAYSTHRAVTGGYGTESNPMLRPFADSNAIYAMTQISPAVMDFLGHKMMTSNHAWMRKFWWVPQVAGAGFSVGAGVHNYRLVP